MKKILIISAIVLVVIIALFENTGEDVPSETEAETTVTKTEETTNKSRSEMTDEDKEEAKRKHEEKKAKEEQAAKAEEEAEAQAKAEEAEKLRKENEAKEKEKAEQEAKDTADAETIYLQIMRENVGSYVDIQFDKTEKTYVMTPTDQGLIDEISMLPMGIGHDDWGVLVDGMAALSKSGKDLVGEGYSMTLVNPLNHENVILWIVDGEIIYNVIDDL